MVSIIANIGGVMAAIACLFSCRAFAYGDKSAAIFLMLYAIFCLELFTAVHYGR